MKVQMIGSGSIFASFNSASYLVNDNILVDIPNGCCKSMKKIGIDVTNIEYVLITHFHGDHFFDIPFLLSEVYLKGNKKITLIGNKYLKEKVYQITKLAFPHSYKKYLNENNITYLDCNNTILIDDIQIESIDVNHGREKNPKGYIFKDCNQTISFTGDSSLVDNIEFMCKESDIIFIDTNMEEANEAHMGVDTLEILAKKYKNIKFVTTHQRENLIDLIKKLKLKNIIIGKDGLIVK